VSRGFLRISSWLDNRKGGRPTFTEYVVGLFQMISVRYSSLHKTINSTSGWTISVGPSSSPSLGRRTATPSRYSRLAWKLRLVKPFIASRILRNLFISRISNCRAIAAFEVLVHGLQVCPVPPGELLYLSLPIFPLYKLHAHKHTYTHTRTHTRIHTHTHTHTHTHAYLLIKATWRWCVLYCRALIYM
jgi:hypothetical protein